MPKGFKSSLANRAVARALALWRRESGLSLAEVTERVKWSAAKTSMMQNGLVPISAADVMALALVYGIDSVRREPVFWAAQRARDPRTFDLTTNDAVPCVGWTYSEVEAEASYVRAVALDVLPPLVRTSEYSAAIEGEAFPEQSHRRYDDLHRARVLSQLDEDPTLRVELVLGQAVLRRPAGGALVMADQLFQLAVFAQLPGVNIYLVPDSAGVVAGMTSFALLSFREAQFDDVVYLDSPHGDVWLESESERRPYLELFGRLMSTTLTAAETAEHLHNAAQNLKDAAR
ncbi:helix-turn-helix domain-containing protein [Lentzea chajnantorensis]